MTKSELIHLCKSGNKEAMGILYSTYSMRMMNIIRKYVSDKKASEDILHDGFIVIFTNIDRLRDESSLEYWMGSIMRNISLKYLERLDLFSMIGDDIDIIDIPDTYDIISYEELDAIIEKLPEGYKTIFRLSVLENKSHKEISKILGIAPSTSSSQLSHAKALLRKLITDYQSKIDLLIIIIISILFLNKYSDTSVNVKEATLSRNNTIASNNHNTIDKSSDASQGHITHLIPIINNENTESNHLPIVDSDTVASYLDIDNYIFNQKIKETSDTIDSIIHLVADTITFNNSIYANKTNYYSIKSHENKWNISIAYSTIRNSNNYSSYHSFVGDDMTSSEQTLQTDYHYNLPIILGINLERKINNKIDINTGIYFTYLSSHIDYTLGDVKARRDVDNYYLSVPIGINYNVIMTNRFSLYIPGKLGVDIPIKTHSNTDNPHLITLPGFNDPKPQLFISSGIGAGYKMTQNINLYFEPTIKFHLNKSPEPSIWEGRSIECSLPIGIRFSW